MLVSNKNDFPPGWKTLLTSSGRDLLSKAQKLRSSGNSFAQINVSLRKADISNDDATALVLQVELQEKAHKKFGADAKDMLFTQSGLEQASRSSVTALHASRVKDSGVLSVSDLGCGIGSQSLAFMRANLDVQAVEIDPLTAQIAELNLQTFFPGKQRVFNADVLSFERAFKKGVFFDPARRTLGAKNTQRITNYDDYSPPLDFIFETALKQPTGIKLGPGFAHNLIPNDFEAEWISVNGETLECVLWSREFKTHSIKNRATIIFDTPEGQSIHSIYSAEKVEDAPQRVIGKYLYEPDGAVIRARQIGEVAKRVKGGMIDPKIAYITSDELHETPFATSFKILEEISPRAKEIKKVLKENSIGRLEIKKRGVDLNPAVLHKQLSPKGPNSAVLFVTRIGEKHVAYLAQRI